MNNVGAVALGILTVFLGSGSVQLMIFLFRRRAEIKELDAKSGAVALEASNNLITRLQLAEQQQREQNAMLAAQHLREIEEMTRRLTAATEEAVRMQRELATLRTDLGIARRQIEQMSGGGHYYGGGRHVGGG